MLAEAGLLGYVVGGPWRAPALGKLCLAANIPADRTSDLYRQTEIVLNVFREVHHFNRQRVSAFSMNPRIYEALACGAAVVSERRTEIDQVFPELPQFSSPDALLAAVTRLLADQTHLARARAQCRQQLAGHSYSDRLKRVIRIALGADAEPHVSEMFPGGPLVAGWEDYGSIARLRRELSLSGNHAMSAVGQKPDWQAMTRSPTSSCPSTCASLPMHGSSPKFTSRIDMTRPPTPTISCWRPNTITLQNTSRFSDHCR